MSTKSIWISLGARTPSSALWILLVLAAVGLPGRSFAAGPYFVKANATGANNGASWANAFTDLQNALAAAKSGDEIWVGAGTYKPTNNSDRNKSFFLVTGAALYGGFAGTETKRDQRDWKSHETILSGDIGTAGEKRDNSYHVVTGTNLAIIDGFIVTSGNSDSAYGNGGGMFINYSSPIITHCDFRNNSAVYGGGMSIKGGAPTITDCTFNGNMVSDSGGGIYNDEGSTIVTNCSFSSNTATGGYGYEGGGGGMYNYGGAPTVTHCTFNGNSTPDSSGGGMYNDGSSPMVSHCTFSGNTAIGSYGGGIYNDYSSPTVTQCTFSGNTAGSGGGMYNAYSSLTVSNCIFNGNSADGVGGGMRNLYCSPTVTKCTFNSNSASSGGGICNSGDSPVVTQSILYGNSAVEKGGGMYNTSNSSPTVTHCTFSGNSASDGGGMANRDSASPTVIYCVFSGNKVTDSGGGMYNYGGAPTVIQCTISGNTADSGGGMCNFGYSSPKVTNTILWINHAPIGAEVNNAKSQPTFRHCSIRGSGRSGTQWDSGMGTDGGGNITADLRFVDSNKPAGPDGIWMTVDDGLRLQANSACVDASDPTVTPESDILDNPRRGLPDIGAYEYQPPSPLNGVTVWAIYD